jgi:hypothetical protein
MASDPPQHYMVRLGYRVDGRSCNSALAAEGWLDVTSQAWIVIFVCSTGLLAVAENVVHRRQRSMVKRAGFFSSAASLMLISAILTCSP